MGVTVSCDGRDVTVVVEVCRAGIITDFNPPLLHATIPRSRIAPNKFLRCMLTEACLDTKMEGILINPGS
jgi:hypothetical protein